MSKATNKVCDAFLPLGPKCVPDTATPTSFVDHTVALHGLQQSNLLEFVAERAGLTGEGLPKDLDFDLPAPMARVLEGAASLCQGSLRCVDAKERPTALSPKARRQFCAQCFQLELEGGRLPHFHYLWVRASLTHCPVHGTPLMLYESYCEMQGRIMAPSWVNTVCGFVPDSSIRKKGRKWHEEPPEKESAPLKREAHLVVSDSGFEWLESAAYGARVLIPGLSNFTAEALRPAQSVWDEFLVFEKELNGLQAPKASVLRHLEQGSCLNLVSDLYTLMTTRFFKFGGIGVDNVEQWGRVEGGYRVWRDWRKRHGSEACCYRGELEDWKSEEVVEVRRTVIRIVMKQLKKVLEHDGGSVGADVDADRAHITKLSRHGGCALINILSKLDEEALDWVLVRQEDWPSPLRELLRPIFDAPVRGERNPQWLDEEDINQHNWRRSAEQRVLAENKDTVNLYAKDEREKWLQEKERVRELISRRLTETHRRAHS